MGSKKKLSLFLALMMIISSLSLGVFAQDTYTIKSGDVLWKIAKNHGMDYKTLAAYNEIADPDKIFAGKTLKFPPVTGTIKPVTPVVTVPPIPAVKTITILHTNDMHGFFRYGDFDGMGAAKMATYINETRAANPNTLLIDAGDALQGDNLVTLSKGEEGTRVLNGLKYDAMAVGNHEFDYGSAQTVKLQGLLNFPMLASNVKTADGKLLLDDYKIFTVDGIKVGVFGVTTPETTYKTHPDNVAGITFADIYKTSEQMVKTLKAEGAQVIIAAAHLGDEGDFTSATLATKVAGIDLILDGHSHSTYEAGKVVNNTLIVSAGEKTKNIGHVELTLTNGALTDKTAKLFTKDLSKTTSADPDMTELVYAINKINSKTTSQVVATSPVLLVGEKAVVRAGESNLGNLITEALLDISKADIAFTNGGGIRASIDVGPVTKGEVLTVLPYGNTVRVIEVTGADILAALEVGVDTYPVAKGAFPHVAGMTVTFDASKAAKSRIVDVKIGGVALDKAKTYKMATNDFIVAGGDGYTMFIGKKVIAEFGAMDEVLIDYMNKIGFGKAILDGRFKELSKPVGLILFKLVA